jgi:hypothetical protein
LRRGKLQEAWLLGRTLDPSEQWNLLESIAETLGREEELGWLKQFRSCPYECLASAYVLVSIDSITWSSSQQFIEKYIPDELIIWNQETSMRKRRILKPRPEALIYSCLSNSESQNDIMLGLESTLKQSTYWQGVLESYMSNGQWISDLKKEQFYEEHFPQDIPDEWSIEDREKSHVPRPFVKESNINHYIYHTLRHSKSLEIWDSTFPPELDCSMDWKEIYERLNKELKEPLLPMKPIKKQFEII